MIGLSVSTTTRNVTASTRLKPKDEIRAIVRALNKTAQQARTGAARDVRANGYNINASAIKRSFVIERATPSKLSITLRATCPQATEKFQMFASTIEQHALYVPGRFAIDYRWLRGGCWVNALTSFDGSRVRRSR